MKKYTSNDSEININLKKKMVNFRKNEQDDEGLARL